MAKGIRRIPLVYLNTAIAVLILDILTKNLAEIFLEGKRIELLPFLELTLIYNRGVAFGLFSEAPDIIRVPILLFTPLIALLITYLYCLRTDSRLSHITMGLIAGGALGNFYDRLVLGKVRDFIYLHWRDLY
jgi:signal peptidase II